MCMKIETHQKPATHKDNPQILVHHCKMLWKVWQSQEMKQIELSKMLQKSK